MWDECNSVVVWTLFCTAFLWSVMKTDLFQSCGHGWVFQICWHIDRSTFTASSLKIWNSSIDIASPPLTLFMVVLPKAHLTSHSRMSGSQWVITPSWLTVSFGYCPSLNSVVFILSWDFFFPFFFPLTLWDFILNIAQFGTEQMHPFRFLELFLLPGLSLQDSAP